MKYYLFIFLFAVMLSGCSQDKESEKEVKVTSTTTEETEQPNKEESKQETPMPVTKLDIENYSLEYKEDTDTQSFFPKYNITKSEKGYYLWGGGRLCVLSDVF